MKKILIVSGLFCAVGFFLYALFWPRKYGSPALPESHSAQYWDLPRVGR